MVGSAAGAATGRHHLRVKMCCARVALPPAHLRAMSRPRRSDPHHRVQRPRRCPPPHGRLVGHYRCNLGVAKLYSIRSIMRIARRPQLGPRTTLPVGWSATCAAYWASCTLRASAAMLSCIASLRCSATRCVLSVTRGRARSLEEKVVGRAGEMCGLCAPGGGELKDFFSPLSRNGLL